MLFIGNTICRKLQDRHGKTGWLVNLLLKVEETVLVLVEVAEHVEALGLADVVDHVVLQELVDVVG
jgi:hypothetical protein